MKKKFNWKRFWMSLLLMPIMPTMMVEGSEGEGEGEDKNKDKNKDDQTPKTFTQEEVSAMMAKEKNQGRSSVLKALGLADNTDLATIKAALEAHNKHTQENMTAVEKAEAAKKLAEESAHATAAERDNLKKELTALKSGVKPESIEAVLALCIGKVDDKTTLEDAIKKVKETYPMFFGEGEAKPNGTGKIGTAGSTNKTDTNSAYGARLAEQRKGNTERKSSYFKR